jgi:hypothetical protein
MAVVSAGTGKVNTLGRPPVFPSSNIHRRILRVRILMVGAPLPS